MRLASGLVALCALLVVAAPAAAQQDRPKGVDAVYKDYEDDGVIEACEHTVRALERTLDGLPPQADIDTPDLRPALEAAIEQVEQDDCPEVVEEEPAPPATPPPPAPAPAVTPVPTPFPTTPPASTPDSSNVAPLPGGDGGGDGGGRNGSSPPTQEDVTPLPEATPAPPAVTPVPPAEPSGPPAEPPKVYDNDDDALPPSLIVLGGLAVLCALLALLYALFSRLGWGERYLLPVRRAGREARFRAGGTWGDFSDWLRVGR